MADIIRKPDKPGDEGNPEVSFERRDVNVFQITAFGIGLLLACLVVVFAMWGMFDFLYKRESEKNVRNPPSMVNQRPSLPPEPRLQGVPKPEPPRVELRQMHEDEDAIRNNYGWLDPNKGIVRIPIDQAIDIVAKKGLPSKPGAAGTENDGYRTIPFDANSGRTLEKISQ
jgi:hypothetical protein